MARARMRFGRRAAACILLLTAAAFPAAASAQEPTATSESSTPALKPGRYVWRDEAAAGSGPVRILVSLPLQLLFAFKGDRLIGLSTVSTGRPGYDTPTGTFPILQKEVDHKSNLYDDAPMPYMQRLTWDGVALHAGEVKAEPASHGCVRLPLSFAKKLYAATAPGATVLITYESPASADEAASILAAEAAPETVAVN